MTPQEAKQKAIIEAYGKYYENLKNDIDENGWCDFKSVYGEFGNNMGLAGVELDIMNPHHSVRCYKKRPKSLQGIETNNGWVKIEPDGSNLPNQDGWYWISYLGDEFICFWASHKNYFIDNDNGHYLDDVTHYQPIIKPQSPIY